MIYQTQLEAKIFEIVDAPLTSMGYEVARIKISHTGASKVLQFMLDRTDGENLRLEDCEAASHHISVLLDVENPIDTEYTLEVSSTGLSRPLTRPKDFVHNVGNIVKLALKAPINGQKKFTGRLMSFENNIATLSVPAPQNAVEINFDHILEAQLDYFASNTKKGEKKS